MKTYDRAYFDRWYRDSSDRVSTREGLERKVRLAVSVAEFLLARRIESVLDIGCGEAPWYPVLRRLRRGVRYVGVDPSAYVQKRFGHSRHIRQGTLGDLDTIRMPRRFDLVVCADVLQYLPTAELERGLAAIRRRMRGIAYIEAFASEDDMEGDRVEWRDRPASELRRLFRAAGLTQCGPYCWVDADHLDSLNALEHA